MKEFSLIKNRSDFGWLIGQVNVKRSIKDYLEKDKNVKLRKYNKVRYRQRTFLNV